MVVVAVCGDTALSDDRRPYGIREADNTPPSGSAKRLPLITQSSELAKVLLRSISMRMSGSAAAARLRSCSRKLGHAGETTDCYVADHTK
jgi:hypothetical protein